MKKLAISISLLLLCACQEADKVIQNPKVQQDSEALIDDLIDFAEQEVDENTGVKIDVQLPKPVPKE